MLMMMLLIYLAVRWAEDREQGLGDKKLVLLTYLLFLSVSIHLTTFLIVPALFIFFVLVDKEKLKDPIFWVTWAVLFSLAVPFYFMVGMVIPWVDDKSYWIWVVMLFVGAIVTGYMANRFKATRGRSGNANYSLAFLLFMSAIIGYSTHL